MACTEQEMKLYQIWREKAEAEDIAAELKAVEGKDDDISDRFYRYLEFGTGGLRGVLGAGTNRMNIYTVSMAAQALADYLTAKGGVNAVAIGYDTTSGDVREYTSHGYGGGVCTEQARGYGCVPDDMGIHT